MFWMFAVALFLAACGSGGQVQATAPNVQPTPPADTSSPVIVLRRSGGFEGVDQLWQIFADGRVLVKEGRATQSQTQVPAQAVNELVAWLEGSGFLAADIPTPNPDETCCDRFLYELTVTAGTRTKTVVVLDSPENLPDDLAEAFRRVATLLGVTL